MWQNAIITKKLNNFERDITIKVLNQCKRFIEIAKFEIAEDIDEEHLEDKVDKLIRYLNENG